MGYRGRGRDEEEGVGGEGGGQGPEEAGPQHPRLHDVGVAPVEPPQLALAVRALPTPGGEADFDRYSHTTYLHI